MGERWSARFLRRCVRYVWACVFVAWIICAEKAQGLDPNVVEQAWGLALCTEVDATRATKRARSSSN